MDYSQLLFNPGTGPQGTVAPQQAAPQAAAPQQALPNVEGADQHGFLDKMRTDPAFTQAMLMMGTRLMQGPKQGQDTFGMLGDAAMLGVAAHNMGQFNQRNNERQDAKDAREAETQQVAVAGQRQAQEQAAEMQPLKIEQLNEGIKKLRTEGRVNEATALIQEYKSGNIKTQTDLENRLKEAQIGASRASAAASGASAAYMGTRAQAAQTLLDQGDAGAVLHGTRSGAGAAKEKLAEIKTYLQAANPEMTEQQIAQEVINMQTGKKGEGIEMLVKLMDAEDPAIRKWATAQMAGKAGYGKEAAKPKGREKAATGGLPPLEERVVGQVYDTPGGKVKWTEDGWVR